MMAISRYLWNILYIVEVQVSCDTDYMVAFHQHLNVLFVSTRKLPVAIFKTTEHFG